MLQALRFPVSQSRGRRYPEPNHPYRNPFQRDRDRIIHTRAFRRLEARGEIRGGRFVDGFVGEQFALPVAVESLRATRKLAPSGEILTISAADPLNLVGIIVPGERIPAISGRTVSYRDGVPVVEELPRQSIAAIV